MMATLSTFLRLNQREKNKLHIVEKEWKAENKTMATTTTAPEAETVTATKWRIINRHRGA